VLALRIVRLYILQHLDRASTLLRFIFALFPLFFVVIPMFLSILLFGFSVFPLLPLFLCFAPLFFLYFLYLFLSTLSTTYKSYLSTVLRSSYLRSSTTRPILCRVSILTTLLVIQNIFQFHGSNINPIEV